MSDDEEVTGEPDAMDQVKQQVDESLHSGLECPHCKGTIPFQIMAQLREHSSVHVMLRPDDGELYDLKTMTSLLECLRLSHKRFAKDFGKDCITLVKSVATRPDGAIDFELLITRPKLKSSSPERGPK